MKADILSAVSCLILLTVSAAIHEAGHMLAAKLAGIPCRKLKFCAAGGMIAFDFSRSSYFSEAFVHLGGAVFGMASAMIAYAALGKQALEYFGATAVLSCVNLLPIRGLDGGAVLLCILNMIFLPDTAEKIAGTVSFVFWTALWFSAVGMGLRGSHDLWLLIFALSVMLIGSG